MYGGEYSKGRKQDDYDFEDSFIDDSDWVRRCPFPLFFRKLAHGGLTVVPYPQTENLL
jgi:hypothetical protein